MTLSFRYPADDLDDVRAQLAAMGSFWSQTYDGVGFVESWIYATAQLEKQVKQDMGEAFASVSRLTVPLYHTEFNYELVLKASEKSRGAVPRFGEGRVFGESLAFGSPAVAELFAFPLPDPLLAAPLITNRLTSPSLQLFDGLDYYIAEGYIFFREDPFADSRVSQRIIYDDNGAVADSEVQLWIFHAQQDSRFISEQFGYQWGFNLPSSASYRDFINALWDAAVLGSSVDKIHRAISAALDIPIAEGEETVEVVTVDRERLLIITDRRVYRFTRESSPVVAVGDVLYAGQPLTDALQFFEFNQGQVATSLLAVHLEPSFLTEGYYGGLTFENREVPVTIGSDGLFTTLQFEIGGWPLDVERFWEEIHDRGVAAGSTLAQLLDQRTNKVGEPTAANLPAVINPLQFLAENVLRNHVFAVQIRLGCAGPDAIGFDNLRALRRILPPHTALLLIVQLEADEEFVTLDGVAGDTASPGATEDLESFSASEPIEETLDSATYIAEAPETFYIGGTCV